MFSTQIIHNYIDIEKYPFQNRKDVAPNLFWVRSIHSIYNPEKAIKVLFELCKKYPHARLCLVGPHKDDCINKIEQEAQIVFPNTIAAREGLEIKLSI